MHLKINSLKKRLILTLGIPLFTILIFGISLDYQLAKQTSTITHDESLIDAVSDLEAHLRRKNVTLFFDLSDEIQAMMRANAPDKIYFSLRAKDGHVLAGEQDLPEITLPSERIELSDGLYQGKKVRIAARQTSDFVPGSYITVVTTTQKRTELSQKILAVMITPNLAVIVATVLAVFFGIRLGLKPLKNIEDEIARRSVNDLREIDLNNAPQEVRPVLKQLNTLFVLLTEASTRQQRFIADAAHQLRTPLTALQTQIDLAVVENAFSHNHERISQIEEATARISRLLTQLLVYARAENVTKSFETVALHELVERSASTFLDAALAKNIDLGFDIQPASVLGLSWMLQEALSNLIDNAIRYTPSGGKITVRCGAYFLEVEDNGVGIATEHLPHIFKRFYRISDATGNGCGLGLPIVQQIAELHAAHILVQNNPNGGMQFKLVFCPLAG